MEETKYQAALELDRAHLLIDISNTYTKVAIIEGGELSEKRRVPTTDLSTDAWEDLTDGWRFDRAVLSSVVPEKIPTVLKALEVPVLVVGPALDLGVAIDYPEPATIGADRLANAAAVGRLYGAPAVVVDFGTAVTFDFVDQKGAYVGGAIAPGLEMMTEYLHRRTALLPEIDLDEPASVIGKTTQEAMRAGAVIGYRGLVREILREIKRLPGFPPQTRVVATGGYAELIATKLPEIEWVEPDLTLLGLAVVAGLNRGSKAWSAGRQTR